METIAIYWEPIIKTYGLFCQKSLACYSKIIPAGAFADAGRLLADGRFEDQPDIALVAVSSLADGGLRLSAVVRPQDHPGPTGFDHMWGNLPAIDEDVESVDLLCFQGPHFGDRFGIAHAVQNDLRREGIRPRLLVCSASSVYLLLAAGMADRASSSLSRSFQHPSDTCLP
ncbi:hypothetical protein [Desulfatirhabdium butyrativorans]|uniref:hypothetical protein n=1 Tax=Desulfatirhabdium butyrativorans TaxID=340467 RepID=UPI0003FD544F|nr:hypothetical protein [Desulfatirhabdium butyrativorans]